MLFDSEHVPSCKPDTLLVAERFVSINGEGIKSGYPAIFIRLQGCNLACSYCDTSWATTHDEKNNSGELFEIAELKKWCDSTGLQHVTITGGEPLLQRALPSLVRVLLTDISPHSSTCKRDDETSKQNYCVSPCSSASCSLISGESVDAHVDKASHKQEPASHKQESALHKQEFALHKQGSVSHNISQCSSNYVVEIETNGTQDIAAIRHKLSDLSNTQLSRLSFTVDYKLPTSGMQEQMNLSVFNHLKQHDAVKFVVKNRADLDRMCEAIQELDLKDRVTILVSPVFGCIEPTTIVSYLLDNKLSFIRLQLQLHKILWPNKSKGV